jgi:hypothetical protein
MWKDTNLHLHPEDGGKNVLRDAGILPHLYTVSKPRRPRPESSSRRENRKFPISITWLFSLKRHNGKGKVVPVLNYAPRHEDLLRPRGKAPCILELCTGRR